MAVLKPLFEKHWPSTLEDKHQVGQKEVRIIGEIEPLLSSHRLVIDPETIRKDLQSIAQYPTSTAKTYSFLHQLTNITLEKDCLKHDDRVEALAGAISCITENISYDMIRSVTLKAMKEAKEHMRIWSNPKIRREEIYGYSKPTNDSNFFGRPARETQRTQRATSRNRFSGKSIKRW